MKIISHRGYWLTPDEKNTKTAFERSFGMGYGTETDVRDLQGELVISHDMPLGGEMPFEEFLQIFSSFNSALPLALNVKSDGLQEKLKKSLKKYNVQNYFLFDMSIPDLLKSLNSELICYGRESEYEIFTDELSRKVTGVWFDYFHSFDLKVNAILSHLKSEREVCLVSPELHGKDYLEYWSKIKNQELDKFSNLMICTDKPEEFQVFLQ